MDKPQGGEKAPSRPKACIGALYFSQTRYDREKPPVCAGLSKRLRGEEGAGPLPTDAVPGGDFRYLCLGYSAYDAAELKRAARRRTSPRDAVQLPYCEGVEVVSAAAMAGKPELLTGGPAPGATGAVGAAGEREADVRERPGRTFVPGGQGGRGGGGAGGGGEIDWVRFGERFDAHARKIADRMAANAAFMGQAAKRSWETLVKEVRDRDR